MNGPFGGFSRVAIQRAIDRYTALGGILVGTGDSTKASQLAVGSNAQVLTVDSTQTLGVKWATPTTQQAYATVQDDGTALTQETTLNVVGRGIVADDSGGVTRLRAFDPLTMAYLEDEFLAGSAATQSVGALSWAFSFGSGALLTGEAGHPGIFRRTSTATSNTSCTMQLNYTFLPAETFDMLFIVRPVDVDANTTIRLGLCNTPANPPTNGIYLEGLSTDFSGSTMTWFLVTRSASSQTRLTSGITTAANAWLKARLRRLDASTVGLTVNAGTEVTQTLTIPTVAVLPWIHLVPTSNSARTLDVDFFDTLITGLSR